MGIKSYRPITPSRRYVTTVDFSDLAKKRPERSLTSPTKQAAGRNKKGHITVRHQGGGHKRLFRQIDFRRDKIGVPAKVEAIEYDPNRSARIALLHYADGEKRYIVAPLGLRPGSMVISSPEADILPGNALPLGKIPDGTTVHNIEIKPGKGGQMVRTAGGGAQVLGKDKSWAILRLPSGEIRRVPDICKATVGQVGNLDHENVTIGKAGRQRWLGIRPTVRGVVQNPCDHPHGGGEGKSPQGNPHPVSPWGWQTKGKKTRKNKRTQRDILKRRPKGVR